jgi:hypothetical protein
MHSDVVRAEPLNVLIVPADAGLDIAPFLPTLRSHFVLVCPNANQVAEVARRFEPDIVFVDTRFSDSQTLIAELAKVAGGRRQVFVAMAPATPPGFEFFLPIPATAGELEQLLWQVSRSMAAPASVSTERMPG